MPGRKDNAAVLSRWIDDITRSRVQDIKGITLETRLLGLNAAIEAAHVGEAGRGFAIVAGRVREVSDRVEELAVTLQAELGDLGQRLRQALHQARGERLSDLALNVIETMDRNLYERTCDVRWWATESAVARALTEGGGEALEAARRRLGIILDTYTVYLDIWIIDPQGRVLANGRPGQYPLATAAGVAGEPWFGQALGAHQEEYAVGDVQPVAALEDRPAAIYAAAVHDPDSGRPAGVLAVFFDWAKQASAIVEGVRLSADDAGRVRCMIVDARHRIIAAHPGPAAGEYLLLHDQAHGYYEHEGALVGYARTPGYETYPELGWHAVLVDRLDD